MRLFILLTLFLTPSPLFAADDDCTAAQPVHVLAGKGDHFQLDPKETNSAHERMNLPAGVKLRIDFSGCADVAQKVFVFTFPKDKHTSFDVKYWAAKTSDALEKIEFVKDWASLKTQLLAFLKKVPTLPTSQRDRNAVEICHDDSKPTTDGCGFQQLGLARFQAKPAGGGTETTLTWSDNL